MPFQIIFFLLIVIVALSGLRIANEWERGVLFFLGRLKAVKGPGLFYVIPVLEFVKKVDLRTVTVDIESQDTITRDNVSIKVNAVVWYRVVDPVNALIRVQSFHSAVYQFAATTLRNTIGVHSLDDLLKERTNINLLMLEIFNETVATWGIEVEKVEIKDIEIPEGMQRALAMEAEALREKRARIIKASAEFEASEQLASAAQVMRENPVALELRRMQMITEVGAEQNSTTIMMMPSDFVSLAREASDLLYQSNAKSRKKKDRAIEKELEREMERERKRDKLSRMKERMESEMDTLGESDEDSATLADSPVELSDDPDGLMTYDPASDTVYARYFSNEHALDDESDEGPLQQED